MNALLAQLRAHAAERADAPALIGDTRTLSHAQLLAEVEALAAQLRARRIATLALYADNGIDWIVADLAAIAAGIRCVPLPRFFTDAQLDHALRDSGADAVLADDPRMASLRKTAQAEVLAVCGARWQLLRLAPRRVELPAQTQKITYTSGTTGDPKGVCLSLDAQLRVADALRQATGLGPSDRHLCVLPLSTLLENVAGVYAALLAGATVCAPTQENVGMDGAAQFDVQRLLGACARHQATSAILVPQLLLALVLAGETGAPRPPSLRFVAMGGAPIASGLLDRAARLGLPVFEGYGLSECASVLALNTVAANRRGSVGKPLPHIELRIAEDGEILARGNGFLGYAGGAARAAGDWVATGDLGHLDADGYLYLSARKKSVFITAFGRNVAPEWVERELTQHAAIAQAAVFGEARPYNVAILTPSKLPGVDTQAALSAAVAAANAALPDYARIRHWICSREPFALANGQLTSNGRVRRAPIAARYAAELDSCYPETST